jgi:hypothetical protein
MSLKQKKEEGVLALPLSRLFSELFDYSADSSSDTTRVNHTHPDYFGHNPAQL